MSDYVIPDKAKRAAELLRCKAHLLEIGVIRPNALAAEFRLIADLIE